ncbi:hypothetical protein ACQKP0_02680 [Heyndrickxia sp. NPDC080065]|uniref:hypothetical protein n=1 Tax=Heyndrickxia sp. NPDC080065 TaxID=3390568 RepID=UPI003D011C26
MGTTFALVDPGGKLAGWYENHFKEKVHHLSKTTTTELFSSLEKLQKELQVLKTNLTKQLDNYEVNQSVETINSIKKHQENQINQLHTVTEEIGKQHKEKMQAYIEKKKEQEAEQLTKDIEDLLTELTQE